MERLDWNLDFRKPQWLDVWAPAGMSVSTARGGQRSRMGNRWTGRAFVFQAFEHGASHRAEGEQTDPRPEGANISEGAG